MAEKELKTSVFTWEGTDRKGGKVKCPPIHALPDEVAGAAKAYVKGTGKTYEDWAAIYERAGGFEDLGL